MLLNQDYDRRSADYDQETEQPSFRVDQQRVPDHKSSLYVQSVNSSIPQQQSQPNEFNFQESSFQINHYVQEELA
jgi:hypothetical protein